MYTLYKCSEPGFEKKFKTLEDLKDKLESHICSACFNEECKILSPTSGEIIAIIPPSSDLEGLDRDYYNSLSLQEKIVELLHTACGCEFDVCDRTVLEISSENN